MSSSLSHMFSHSESTQVGGAAPVCHAGPSQPTRTQMTKSLSVSAFKTSLPMGLGHISLLPLADIVPFPHWPKMNPMNTYSQSIKRSPMCAVLLNVLGYGLSLNCTPTGSYLECFYPSWSCYGGSETVESSRSGGLSWKTGSLEANLCTSSLVFSPLFHPP